jgi:DNA polymerase-3 subunit alpha
MCNTLKENIDYQYYEKTSCYIVKKTKIKSILDNKIENMVKDVLNSKVTVEQYNKLKLKELYDKHAEGNIFKWEMDSMNYYKTGHELDCVNKERYTIQNFFDLPYDPIVNDSWTNRNGKEFKRYKLSLIMGTVLDRDKTKHTVSLLTTDGVVTCKLYDGAFNFYNKTISQILPNGKKKRVEESWFKRGTKILVYGFRMGDQFKPRKYKNSIFQHSVMRINEVNEDGTIVVQQERTEI